MKALLSTATAALLAISFATAANAVPSKASRTAMAQHQASCKAQAAKKYSAVHFLKRRDFVNECMGRTAKSSKVQRVKTAKVNKKSQTTGQAAR
jgi:hypothetical protein